jgi:hypothetical protein
MAPAMRAEVVRTYPASEATQGVAVHQGCFFAITNRRIGKYRIDSGGKLAEFVDAEGGRLIHMNGGVVMAGRLYAFHPNFPGVPHENSVEIFSIEDLKHVGSLPLTSRYGSFVWAVEHPQTGQIWACFGHYNERGGVPGIKNDQTTIVVYDRRFRDSGEVWLEAGLYRAPADLVARWDGMTASGGVFLPDGRLLLTGHHAPELHLVRAHAGRLELLEVIASPNEGQGLALGMDAGDIWQIQRKDRTVVRMRLSGAS